MNEQKRKYTDEQYLDFEYFEGDDENSHNELKIVKTRKEHDCVSIYNSHKIPAGSRAINETAIHVDNGRVSCYLCFECADLYLDEIYGDDE